MLTRSRNSQSKNRPGEENHLNPSAERENMQIANNGFTNSKPSASSRVLPLNKNNLEALVKQQQSKGHSINLQQVHLNKSDVDKSKRSSPVKSNANYSHQVEGLEHIHASPRSIHFFVQQ